MDVVAWDNYPAYNTPWSLTAMRHDLMRGLKNQPFMPVSYTHLDLYKRQFLTGEQQGLTAAGADVWCFLILSGLATGASWLCYFRAVQLGDVSRVAPIDKSSAVLTVLLALLLFREPVSAWKMCIRDRM